MKIIKTRCDDLYIEKFMAQPDQAWCIIGRNRSGIDSFFDLVSGENKPIKTECLELPEDTGYVSFKKQQAVYENELEKDETDYIGMIDPGTPARDFIENISQFQGLIKDFGMAGCMGKGYRQLSTGQSRKLMLLSQISRGSSALMIQSPFDGLDIRVRKELVKALEVLHYRGVLIILFVNNLEDIPDFCTHVALVNEGRIEFKGLKNDVIDQIKTKFRKCKPGFIPAISEKGYSALGFSDINPGQAVNNAKSELVCLKNGFAGYSGKQVFQNFSLTIRQGDNTLISGPNGCGKSTLLHLITGDHPSCYANDLKVFGMQRGTGESIWDIKKKMGIVSPELHRNYYIPGPLIQCVLSGFFDSIGVYQKVTQKQKIAAMQWIEQIGLGHKAMFPFRNLSYSDQRLTLIARAMIKCPVLLILDEPTQGLDSVNRNAVLNFLGWISKNTKTTILYVSHRKDEFRPFFQQHINMDHW